LKRARGVRLAFSWAFFSALLGGACQTVNLGAPPADVNACRPSQSFFVTDVWPNVLSKDYAGKRCFDSSCHDVASGKSLSLIADPMPAIDPTMPIPLPLPGDWQKNYISASEQMSCSDVTASDLIEFPTATKAHGGNKLFALGSPEATTLETWVTAP
jgi:hypothetical protein